MERLTRAAHCHLWSERVLIAVHDEHGDVAWRPSTMVGIAHRRRDSSWWATLQALGEVEGPCEMALAGLS